MFGALAIKSQSWRKKSKRREGEKKNLWAQNHKDHNNTWHTFQSIKKKEQHSHTFAQYSHIHLYIYAYKTPKNRGTWLLWCFPVVEADSEHCFSFFFYCFLTFFIFFFGAMCREAVLAQGARPSQPGPRSRAAAQKHREGEEEALLNRTWARPPPDGASFPVPEAPASVWACHSSWPSILFPFSMRTHTPLWAEKKASG